MWVTWWCGSSLTLEAAAGEDVLIDLAVCEGDMVVWELSHLGGGGGLGCIDLSSGVCV